MSLATLARNGAIIAFASIMVACGRVDQFSGPGSADGSLTATSTSYQSPTGDKQLDAVNSVNSAVGATKSAESAIYEAQSALSELTDANGNIALNVFKTLFSRSPTANRGGLLAFLTNRIQSSFDALFTKATALKGSLSAARLALTVANAQLDLNDPAQALIAQQIVAQMSALDAMEVSLKSGMTALASKVDQAQSGLTKLVSLGTSFIPVPGLNYVADLLINTFLLGDLTSLLNSMKLKLLSF